MTSSSRNAFCAKYDHVILVLTIRNYFRHTIRQREQQCSQAYGILNINICPLTAACSTLMKISVKPSLQNHNIAVNYFVLLSKYKIFTIFKCMNVLTLVLQCVGMHYYPELPPLGLQNVLCLPFAFIIDVKLRYFIDLFFNSYAATKRNPFSLPRGLLSK